MSNSQILPTHVKQVLLTVIIFFSTSAFAVAQTTPATRGQTDQAPHGTGTTKQGQQGTQQGQQSTQQGQQGQQGWQWFDDNATRDMDLNDDSRKQLREMDERYRKDYDAMGDTPWTHQNYQDLTNRRNAEIQRTLTPEQHKQWSSRSGQGSDTRGGSSPSQDRGTMAPR